MNVLVACEESKRVCTAFRRRGHNAFSCDLMEPSGGHPEWHILGDCLPLLNGRCEFRTMDGESHVIEGRWDMIIAFPPCTHLAALGARWFENKRKNGKQREAIEFFIKIANADCEKICIENPVGIMSGNYLAKHFPDIANMYGWPKKPSQIIQPWQFGSEARKATCLWEKGLEKLTPTKIVGMGEIKPGGYSVGASADCARDEKGKIIRWNDPRTAQIRSKTYPGVGEAMSEQWG